MLQKLPYDDWIEAQRELKALRLRARMLNLPDLDPLLLRAFRTLTIDNTPAIAGIELEYIAAQVRAYPEMREALMKLSRRIIDYPTAASSPS